MARHNDDRCYAMLRGPRRDSAPLRDNATLDAVGGTAVYLASDAGACTSGEIIHVDGGFHILGMPQGENL